MLLYNNILTDIIGNGVEIDLNYCFHAAKGISVRCGIFFDRSKHVECVVLLQRYSSESKT